jgi:PAS domain S-box-containing protein
VPTRSPQSAVLERLWRRAEEIRSLCGLPPAPRPPSAVGSADAHSLESLVSLLLRDLETNFRRELATRVQLEGLSELLTAPARDPEPGQSYRLLVNYLARALDEPRLWLGVVDGSPPTYTLYYAGDPSIRDVRPERVHLQWLHPAWLSLIAMGEAERGTEGDSPLWTDPSGSRQGGPWFPIPIRGEVPRDRITGEPPICPGALARGGTCPLSRLPLEAMAGGHQMCGRCEFGHVIGVIGVEGSMAPGRRAALEAVVPSLGAILVNLAFKEALDLEARFRDAVIENLPIGVAAIDARGRIVTWNHAAAAITGLDRGPSLDATLRNETSSPRSWHGHLLESLEHGTEHARAEQSIARPDGTELPAEVAAAPIRDAEGRVRGAVATLVDLSDLRSMEERIRQLDRLAALGRFASSVAHELRNPLTGIAAGVEYLSRGFPAGDERLESIGFILREVVRLNSIIQDLFSATRPRTLTLAPVALAELTERAVRSLAPAAEQGNVAVVLDSPSGWPRALADADQMLQVLLNLIQNAIQATPPGGTVTIRARRAGSADHPLVEIEVIDTGTGIDAEHRSHIFEPFYTTRPKGTGLGLFVAHGIVQRHGGTIEVESGPGSGTRFRIALPETAATPETR